VVTDILIVEDDSAIAELYAIRLRMDGYKVHHAADLATAHVIFDRTNPQVVCMDTRLAGTSGREAATEFAGRNSTVILLTNDHDSYESPPPGVTRALLKARTSPSELSLKIAELVGRPA